MKIKIISLWFTMLTLSLIYANDTTEVDSNITHYSADSGVYVIYTSDNLREGGAALAEIQKETFKGIPCIVGKGLKSWYKDQKIIIPIDKITAIFEFKNKDEYEAAIKTHKIKKATEQQGKKRRKKKGK